MHQILINNEPMSVKNIIMFFSSVVVVCTSFGAATAAAYIEQNIPITNTLNTSVLEDVVLRSYCLIGSIIGAWICLTFFTPQSTVKQLSARFIASTGSGVMFTPIILHYTNLPKTVDIIAGVSTFVAIFALGTLAALTPTVIKWAESFFKR